MPVLTQRNAAARLVTSLSFPWLLVFCLVVAGTWVSAQTPAPPKGNAAVLLSVAGKVEYLKAGTALWAAAPVNHQLSPGDQLRTGERSRATVRLSNLSVIPVNESTTLLFEAPAAGSDRPILDLRRGAFYIQNRDRPAAVDFRTRFGSGAIRGTEFHLALEEDGRAVLTLIDGVVELTNQFGALTLTNGDQGILEAGRAPSKTAALDTINIIQWILYYPGVLDVDELGLTADAQQTLSESLAAYRSGDLLKALEKYPEDRQPASDPEKIYRAALLLAVGQVAQVEAQLKTLSAPSPLSDALRKVIAAVKFQPYPITDHQSPITNHQSPSTQLMAESYYQQSRSKLEEARDAARAAVVKSPNFGFAHVRLAEMEFSFGRTREALAALDKGLQLSPRNAQGLALKGFLLAAENRSTEALNYFDQAIAVDGGLGNAWLGRGLVRIHLGQAEEGRKDLQVAAALEPQRALLRSYLGKAFHHEGRTSLATKELNLAKHLDPMDPTAWLYSALLHQQENRINEALRDLERSKELNNNRSVYRSKLLLDQDQAVRSANLASVYEDAGMTEVSVREASRGVQSDYANYSAHLFLANSYGALLDPKGINLRYETPAFSEYLVANLLAPAAAGPLSQTISQQEYAKLFQRDRLGLSSSTEYFSGGDWIQKGAQFGVWRNSSYALETSYRSENGQRPNNDLEQLSLSVLLKEQVTPRDGLYFQAIYADTTAGDLTQYYDQRSANTALRTKETQEPNILMGYHHEWSPGMHTLLFAGRFADDFKVTNPFQPVLLLGRNAAGQVTLIQKSTPVTPAPPVASQNYRSALEIYTAEAQQIWQPERHSLILGARYQAGVFDAQNSLGASTATQVGNEALTLPFLFATPATNQSPSADFERLSVYGYHNWQVFEPLLLTAGISYDRLKFPQNHRVPPLSNQEEDNDQVSPKAGIIWTPWKNTTVRGSYTRSLGGVSLDQSLRLEPTQIAGFNQSYRSVISESVVGSVANAFFQTWGLGLDHRFKTGTYIGVDGEMLESEVSRTIGAFALSTVPPFPVAPSSTRQELDYREQTLTVTLNQLVGEHWSLGGRYRISEADLNTLFPEIPAVVSRNANADSVSTLQQFNLFALFHHPCGFFARADALWSAQSNRAVSPGPGDDFWQFGILAGYRFPRRQVEISVGVLNLTDRDYRLNPLNLYSELPRERTFVASLRFNF